MKIACIWISHLPVKVELHRHPHLKGKPVVIAQNAASKRTVLDAHPSAEGISPGMPLSAALARCKEAVLLEADLPHYQRVHDAVLDALEARGADVEDAGIGLAYARLDGLELMYRGEARLVNALLNAVPAHLHPRIGVGVGKFPAWVSASLSAPGSAQRVPEDARGFMAPLSVDLLPLPWQIKERLHGFGLRDIGQIAALPIGSLLAQFGPGGRELWEFANGIDRRPLTPRKQITVVEESLRFSDPMASLSGIVMAADTLLGRVLGRKEMRGRFARVCTLGGTVFRAPEWARHMVFKQPIGDRRRATELVRDALTNQPPPGPLEDLSITLSELTGEAGRQESLFVDVRRQENLREAVQQMEARLGKGTHLFSIRELEPWSALPEERMALVPYAP